MNPASDPCVARLSAACQRVRYATGVDPESVQRAGSAMHFLLKKPADPAWGAVAESSWDQVRDCIGDPVQAAPELHVPWRQLACKVF